MLLIYLSNTGRLRALLNAFLSLELALMVGYGFLLQRDYIKAWQYQRDFWTELLPLIPDAGPGTIILVDGAAFRDVSQIDANTWNLPRILKQLYVFPSGVENAPAVYRLAPDWEERIVAGNGRFQINPASVSSPSDYYGEFDSTQVILIDAVSGRLVRHAGPLELGGRAYALKTPSAPVLPDLLEDLLFDLIINQP